MAEAKEEVKEEISEEMSANQEEKKAPPSKKELEKQDKRRIKEQEKAFKRQEKEDKKNRKYEKRAKKRERKHKWKTSKLRKILFQVIFLGIMASIVAVLVFNVFDIRDKYLRQYLEEVPFIAELLPPPTESSIEDLKSKEDLKTDIDTYKTQIETLENTIAELEQRILDDDEEIERLKVFEDEYLDFLEEKQLFDEAVGSENSEDFIEFYENMYPENAERVYADLKDIEIDITSFNEYITVYSGMEPSSVGSIMEELMVTDIQLVVAILDELSPTFAGEILATMPPDKAATIAKLLAPSNGVNN